MNDEEIRHLLQTTAAQAGPLNLTADPQRAASRRRRLRRVRTSAACAAAVCATLLTAGLWQAGGGKGDDDTAGPAQSTGPVAQETGHFTCGQPIPYPTVEKENGFSISLTTLHRDSPTGPPQVTFTINAPEPTGLNPTEVYPTVLLLRDGIVIGGPVPDGGLGPGRMLRLPLWGPQYGWPITAQQSVQSWLCGVTTWDEVWAHPDRYDLAVVMTPPSENPEPGNSGFSVPAGPLLMALAPLESVATVP